MYINFRNFTQQGYPVGYVTICVVTNNVCKQKKNCLFHAQQSNLNKVFSIHCITYCIFLVSLEIDSLKTVVNNDSEFVYTCSFQSSWLNFCQKEKLMSFFLMQSICQEFFVYYLLKNIIKLKDLEIILFTSLDMHVSR